MMFKIEVGEERSIIPLNLVVTICGVFAFLSIFFFCNTIIYLDKKSVAVWVTKVKGWHYKISGEWEGEDWKEGEGGVHKSIVAHLRYTSSV